MRALTSKTGPWWAANEILLATMIWGAGFTATIWVFESFDAVSTAVLRFLAAYLIGQLLLALPFWRNEISFRNLKLSLIPGALLGFIIALQTWGLELTSVTNSGFITTLYVVFVPLFEVFILKHKPRRLHYFWVSLALTGTALMINLEFTQLRLGDLLTLFCAILSAIQIIWIGRISPKITSAFAFNVYQSLWAGLGAAILWPLYGQMRITSPSIKALAGFFFIVIGSSLIAFALQVKAQKVIRPALASLIFLLESPFAMIFAIILINEQVTHLQGLGGLLIFISAIGATRTAHFTPSDDRGTKSESQKNSREYAAFQDT